ncbi:type I restriction enzyme HsdR N-terminal domain-containing protein [Chryseosolibacter indicus]|uniref:Type I restriction enzyme HsdR N-terminal domain-containing protein n=1 Tax=Chryseosolibacter indicus TaxID=2782351 RepID=A0ABS5VWN8_9BACT|nr:type I restriction enzyme HsdR N-terminal domain-containing protein [Chryseosolibacter indicus]MBT1705154.1 type I restriction enzyme HsdR N-terminal domain-containing protein [Chryseosolibacter indicus]
MISSSKSEKMLLALKDYKKRYLTKNLSDLDESGTRIMINTFLTSILGYQELEEIKTEFMIKGTYADYIVQTGGKRHFLVEVKAFSIDLSDKHLRQAINYGANEGIEWAVLTNGRQFQFYRILFEKPISEKLVFEIDFHAEDYDVKEALELLTYFHKDAIVKKSLDNVWARYTALEPIGLAGLLFSPHVVSFLKKELRAKYDTKFEDEDILEALTEIVCLEIPLEKLKIPKFKAKKKKTRIKPTAPTENPIQVLEERFEEEAKEINPQA